MITVERDTPIPSVSQALGIIQAHNDIMPVFLDFDKIVMYVNHFLLKQKRIGEPLFEMLGWKPTYQVTLDTALVNWLRKTDNLYGFEFNSKGVSLSDDSIKAALGCGKLSDEAKIVLHAYQEYDKCKRLGRTMMAFLQLPVVNMKSFDGPRMVVLTPKWRAQNTGRIAMYEPALQNIARELQDIITVPYGWVHLHTDSGQVEPRIIYSAFMRDPQIQALIKLYNDAYFGVLHYITMPDEMIISGTTTFEKMKITDALKGMRNEIKTHQNAVMYGSTSNKTGSEIKDKLIKRIGQHPMRKLWLQDIETKVNKGVVEFPTYFGSVIDISKSEKLEDKEGEEAIHQKIKLAINNPIQGTSADLMRLSMAKADYILRTKAKNSAMLMYIHDAGVFAVHEDDYDKVYDELADIVSYDVEGWIPIHAEPEVGRNGGLFKDLY